MEIKYVVSSASDEKIKHFFISTTTQEQRDLLYDHLLGQKNLKIETITQNQMTLQWQNGSISNYDYLLYINRFFHELIVIIFVQNN